MLHSGDGVFVVMCIVWCPSIIASYLMAKKLHFGFIRPKNFLPLDCGSPTCLLANSCWDLMSFLQQWLSHCHSPIKLWQVKNPGNSCSIHSLFHLSCWSLYLLLARSLSLWGRPDLSRFTHVPYSFHFLIIDLTAGDVQCLRIIFVSIPWLILFNNLFSDLLGVFFCLHAVMVARNTD